jgi:hypothetical protein
MNTNDFISINGVKFGTRPYYVGTVYNEDAICFATFGAKQSINYGDFKTAGYTFTSDLKSDFLSIQNNDLIGDYRNDLYEKTTLASKDDYIRKKEGNIAIPTKAELETLLNNSTISCRVENNGKLDVVIDVYDNDNTHVGEIEIPTLGYVNYISDNKNNPTEYTLQRNGKNTYCNGTYEYYDVYLLTSDLKYYGDNGDATRSIAQVYYIKIAVKYELDKKTPDPYDLEFVEYSIDSSYFIDNIKCNEGLNSFHKDSAFMVLPIRYDGDIEVEVEGELLLNDYPIQNFNQTSDPKMPPVFEISPFGTPEIKNSVYNFTFTKALSNGYSEILTRLHITDVDNLTLYNYKKCEKLNDGSIKIEHDSGYWIINDNECLYLLGGKLIFDDRNLFGENNNTGNISIKVNFYKTTNHDVPDDNFVLPSIYKPFYIKKLYTVEDKQSTTNSRGVNFSMHINAYNGIGLFAYKGLLNENLENHKNPCGLPNTSSVDKYKHVFCGSVGFEEMPVEVETTLNEYFGNTTIFSEKFNYFYQTNRFNDLYAIGVSNSNFDLSGTIGVNFYDVFVDVPIFRHNPLILSNYNDSVFDFICCLEKSAGGPNNAFKDSLQVIFEEKFNSVIEPNEKFKFNRDINTESITKYFGEYYGDSGVKINQIDDTSYEVVTWKDRYFSNGSGGVRYYIVNEAFYNNYLVPNGVSTQSLIVSDSSRYDFIRYKEEYYKNREYYDLNPHLVDFKNSDLWNDETKWTVILGIDENGNPTTTEDRYDGYVINFPSGTKMYADTHPDKELTFTNTFHTSSVSNLQGYYTWTMGIDTQKLDQNFIVMDLMLANQVNLDHKYKVSFWVRNSDTSKIRIQIKLSCKKGDTGWYNNNDSAIFIVGTGETRYIEFLGYPFGTSSNKANIQLWIGPDEKDEKTKEYKQTKYDITTIFITEFASYVPFFDMIPALRNSTGCIYSTGNSEDIPNFKAPMASEVYNDSGGKTIVDPSMLDSYFNNDINQEFYFVGVYSPLTQLSGLCTDENENNSYVKQIKYGNQIIPQIDSTSIIVSYGSVGKFEF